MKEKYKDSSAGSEGYEQDFRQISKYFKDFRFNANFKLKTLINLFGASSSFLDKSRLVPT